VRPEGPNLVTFPSRALVVDDFDPWRTFASSALKRHVRSWIVSEARDGPSAIQMAQELQPDLILLDIGLPILNGIEAARRIRQCAPKSTILFASEHSSADIAREALSTGARGYVLKSDAARELLSAVDAVLQGKRFVSSTLASHGLTDPNRSALPR
jgi:DNA-binding NarL/FixJ family response regulator